MCESFISNFNKNYSEQSPAYRKGTITKKDLDPPKQIILIGGGTGWHFTDRPFAAHFEYTPIYKSIATFKLEGTKVSCNSEAIIEELKNDKKLDMVQKLLYNTIVICFSAT